MMVQLKQSSELGMDSASVSIPLSKDGKREWRIDVPMRSFQGGMFVYVLIKVWGIDQGLIMVKGTTRTLLPSIGSWVQPSSRKISHTPSPSCPLHKQWILLDV
mgnify:CR=1 FL=1